MLEVGGGEGELAERIVRELGVELVLVDQSERMVELSRGRGLDARVGDVQSLPFADESFDCTVAAWMLYHAADVGLAICRARPRHAARWSARRRDERRRTSARSCVSSPVTAAGGRVCRSRARTVRELLARSFSNVEARHADGWVVDSRRRRDLGVPALDVDVSPLRRAPAARAAASRPAQGDDLRRHEVIRPAELIQRKRDGHELAADELAELILGYARGEVPDYQMAAFCMAVYFRGLSAAETYVLTDAMIRSGETIDLGAALGRKVVDKHSTGGVGDKTSLAVGPIVAACGVPLGKMSGRGLGHTGGTLDKLESIPGFRTELTLDEFVAQVRDVGMAIIGQTADLVPADKLLYALRDVTATVDQTSLIAASIMSKKLAAGAQAIVLDVKVGDGAFMKTIEDARGLAETMIAIGQQAGREVTCLLTDMDQPLGAAVGNALEVREARDTVRGHGPPDFTELVLDASARLLALLGPRDRRGRGSAARRGGRRRRLRRRDLAALDRGAGRHRRRGRAAGRAGRARGRGAARRLRRRAERDRRRQRRRPPRCGPAHEGGRDRPRRRHRRATRSAARGSRRASVLADVHARTEDDRRGSRRRGARRLRARRRPRRRSGRSCSSVVV